MVGGGDGTDVLYRRVDESRRTGARTKVRIAVVTVVAIAGALLLTMLLRNMFVQAHRVIGWAVACTVVAAIVHPLVAAAPRMIPRPIVLVLVGLLIAAIAGLLVYGVFDDLDTEVARLQDDGVAAAEQLEARDGFIGDLARDVGLAQRADDFFAELDQGVSSGGEAIVSAAGTAPTYLVCWILTIFLILYGGRMVQGGLGLIDDERRRARLRAILDTAIHNARRYTLASLAQGLVAGLIAASVVLALDLPAPVLVGLLAGTVAMVPYLGIVVGALPLALFAAGISSPAAGAFVLVGAGGLQAVEMLVVRPRVDRGSVHVGAAVPVIVGAIGFEVYGIGGAIYGVAIAVFLLAVADAAADDDEPVPLPTEDPSDLGAEPAT